MTDHIDFPINCNECGGHVFRSNAVEYKGSTYCEECAEEGKEITRRFKPKERVLDNSKVSKADELRPGSMWDPSCSKAQATEIIHALEAEREAEKQSNGEIKILLALADERIVSLEACTSGYELVQDVCEAVGWDLEAKYDTEGGEEQFIHDVAKCIQELAELKKPCIKCDVCGRARVIIDCGCILGEPDVITCRPDECPVHGPR